MKFSHRAYMQPTPRNLRRLGDGLLAAALVVTTTSIAVGNNTLAYISLGVSVLGKFLTNFFAE